MELKLTSRGDNTHNIKVHDYVVHHGTSEIAIILLAGGLGNENYLRTHVPRSKYNTFHDMIVRKKQNETQFPTLELFLEELQKHCTFFNWYNTELITEDINGVDINTYVRNGGYEHY